MFTHRVEYNEEQQYNFNFEKENFRIDATIQSKLDDAPFFLAYRNTILRRTLSYLIPNAFYHVEDGKLYLTFEGVFSISGILRDGLSDETIEKAHKDVLTQYEMSKIINTFVRAFLTHYVQYGRCARPRNEIVGKYVAKWRKNNLYVKYYVVDVSLNRHFVVTASNISGALRRISRYFHTFELVKDEVIANLYISKKPKVMREKHLSKSSASFKIFEEHEVDDQVKSACNASIFRL